MPDIVTVLGEELVALTISLMGLTVLRFVLGAYSAFADGTFVLGSLAAFLRTQVVGRVMPILTAAYFAYASGNVALVAFAGTLGAAYAAETLGAIQEALSSTAKADVAEKTILAESIGNPVPQD
jgi:hypothetical protein